MRPCVFGGFLNSVCPLALEMAMDRFGRFSDPEAGVFSLKMPLFNAA
jgi:hypothetical protein